MCVCCACVLFKAPARVRFINSQVKERNSLASAISLIILNKVNINIYMAFAQKEYQECQCFAICSSSVQHRLYKVQPHSMGGLIPLVVYSFPLKYGMESLPIVFSFTLNHAWCRIPFGGVFEYCQTSFLCPPHQVVSKHTEKTGTAESDRSGFSPAQSLHCPQPLTLVFSCCATNYKLWLQTTNTIHRLVGAQLNSSSAGPVGGHTCGHTQLIGWPGTALGYWTQSPHPSLSLSPSVSAFLSLAHFLPSPAV